MNVARKYFWSFPSSKKMWMYPAKADFLEHKDILRSLKTGCWELDFSLFIERILRYQMGFAGFLTVGEPLSSLNPKPYLVEGNTEYSEDLAPKVCILIRRCLLTLNALGPVQTKSEVCSALTHRARIRNKIIIAQHRCHSSKLRQIIIPASLRLGKTTSTYTQCSQLSSRRPQNVGLQEAYLDYFMVFLDAIRAVQVPRWVCVRLCFVYKKARLHNSSSIHRQ